MTNRDQTLTDEQARPWARKYEWEVQDATLLLIGIDPHSERGQFLKEVLIDKHRNGTGFEQLSEDEKSRLADAHEIVELAYSADGFGKLTIHDRWKGSVSYGVVVPSEFLNWAQGNGYEIPAAFASLIADEPGGVEPRRWPWGDHTTRLLDALAAAGEEFWKGYSTGATAPTSDTVKDWLVQRHHVGKRVAEVMAQILRADSLPKGPRPPEIQKTSRPSKALEK